MISTNCSQERTCRGKRMTVRNSETKNRNLDLFTDGMGRLIDPETPFIWPEPRILEQIASYQNAVPFETLGEDSDSIFGIVSALSGQGIDALKRWLEHNPSLRVRLIIAVYPTCLTTENDLIRIRSLTKEESDCLQVRVKTCMRVTDRPSN